MTAWDLWDNKKQFNMCVLWSLKKKKGREWDRRTILKNNNKEFSNINRRYQAPKIQEHEWIPGRINAEKIIQRQGTPDENQD